MKRNRRLTLIAGAIAATAALAIGGSGIARAVGGGSETITGSAAERAKAAALDAAGGGTVLEVERQDGDGAGIYEVEVRRAEGSTVEIHLDAQFQQVGSPPDDDSGADDDGGGSDD